MIGWLLAGLYVAFLVVEWGTTWRWLRAQRAWQAAHHESAMLHATVIVSHERRLGLFAELGENLNARLARLEGAFRPQESKVVHEGRDQEGRRWALVEQGGSRHWVRVHEESKKGEAS